MPEAGAIIGGTILKAKAQHEQAKADKAIADANAAQFEVKAEQEEQIAREEQRVITKAGEREKARLRVLAANAGIDLIGTPLLNIAEVGGEVERQRLQAGQAGRGRAFDLRFRGATERARGRNIRLASRFRTGTTLLSGGGQAFSALPEKKTTTR